MSLREKLKQAKSKEITVEIDGDSYLVCGLTRTAKNKLAQSATPSGNGGKMDVDMFEAMMLAACVYDPTDGELLLSEPSEWDNVPSHITGPLVAACTDVCGFEEKKDKDAAKN